MSNDTLYCCTECEAEFKVEHDEVNEPKYCPFCSEPLDLRDELDTNEEED